MNYKYPRMKITEQNRNIRGSVWQDTLKYVPSLSDWARGIEELCVAVQRERERGFQDDRVRQGTDSISTCNTI